MIFGDEARVVPDGVHTDEFILRPLRAADVELDHAAVMESREILRTWEQSGWPEDDFTVEANLEDLQMMEQAHAERRRFTFTVMNPDETECLGCVYLMPMDAKMFADAEIEVVGEETWSAHDATVHFWVRASRLADALDRRLLDVIRAWLEHDWGAPRCLIVTNEEFTQQVEMIEQTDLDLQFRLTVPGESGRSLAYT